MVTAERLKELLDYDERTGIFTWRHRGGRGRAQRNGRIAGSIDTWGHRQIKVDGRAHQAHRLAWLYVYGEWPSADLDHVNRSKDDNRISNLRLDIGRRNQQNVTVTYGKTKSGFRGVSETHGRWQARIAIPGSGRRSLGCFGTPEEAHVAYLNAKAESHPFFSGGG